MAGYVEAALGRELQTLFRNERDHVRFDGQGDFCHGLIGGHLQIELGTDEFPQEAKVAILNMPPIFSEVDNDAIGARQFNQHGSGKGIRINSPTGLPQCGHMVDVHPKSWHGSSVFAMWCKEKLN